jgi:hypothetical protein
MNFGAFPLRRHLSDERQQLRVALLQLRDAAERHEAVVVALDVDVALFRRLGRRQQVRDLLSEVFRLRPISEISF